MLKRAIATRYANALFTLAKEKDILEDVERDFPVVAEVIKNDEDLARFLTHPAIGADEKKKVMAVLFEGKIHETLYDLIGLAVDKNREEYIPLIWDDFRKLLMDHRKQVKAVVYSPYELSAGIRGELEEKLSKVTGKTVLIEDVEDPDLIGGIKIQIGDRVYDGSVSSMMGQIREELMSARV